MFALALWVLGTIGVTAGLGRGLIEIHRRLTYRYIRKRRALVAALTFELETLTNDDADVRAGLDRHPMHHELVAASFHQLGDLRLASQGAVYRFFASPSQRTLAYFDLFNPRGIVVESATATEAFTTSTARPSFLAMPPTHQAQSLPAWSGARSAIAEHETWLARLRAMTDAPPELLRWRSLDDVIEQSRIQCERLVTWRNDQGEDLLLELDLRALLPSAYDKDGARYRRHLAEKPPVARLAPPRTRP